MKKQLLIGFLACSNPAMANDIKASIEITTADGYIHVAPLVENMGSDPIQQWEYHLSVSKQSLTGSSASKQSGQLTLAAGDKQQLSQTRFNQSKDEQYRFALTLWHHGTLILETRQSFPEIK